MKYLFLVLLSGSTLLACKNNESNNESTDYGLLILQKRIDSLDKRVNAMDSSIRELKAPRKE